MRFAAAIRAISLGPWNLALALFERTGLRQHLTPQRSNGFRSMVERIRADARAAIEVACRKPPPLRP